MADPLATGRTVVELSLRVGSRLLQAEVALPCAPIRVVDLLPVLMSLDDAVLNAVTAELARQGRQVSCRKGCGACCRQLVPISEAEAQYVAELVAQMPPERREHVESRFGHAVAELGRGSLLERLRGAGALASREELNQLGVDYFALGVPCPFLEEQSCSVHPHRPLVCREYLVTSPPEYCAGPLPQRSNRVLLPRMVSEALRRFGDGAGENRGRWLPLVLALEWAAGRGAIRQARAPGPELFRRFLECLQAAPVTCGDRAAPSGAPRDS